MCERIANESLLPPQGVLPPLDQRKLQRKPLSRGGKILSGEKFPNICKREAVLLEKKDYGYLVKLPPVIEPVAVGRRLRGSKEPGLLIVFQRSRRYTAERGKLGYGKAFLFHAVFLPKGLDLYVAYRFMISSTPKKEKRISHGTHAGKRGAAAASLFSISAETAWMLNRTGREFRRVAAGKPVLRRSYAVLMAKIGLPSIAQRSVLALGADVLTSLYLPDRSGAAFALARSYFLLLIPNYFLQFGKTSLEAVFKAHLKIPLVTVSAMLSLAVRVALGYALAPSYGITALAWATNAGSAAALALCFIFYRIRFHGTPA